MLNLSGDTASDVEFWTNRNTSLTDLTIMVCETSVNSSTAGTYFCVKFFSEVEQ